MTCDPGRLLALVGVMTIKGRFVGVNATGHG